MIGFLMLFSFGAVASRYYPMLFYPLCLRTYPNDTLARFVIYIGLILCGFVPVLYLRTIALLFMPLFLLSGVSVGYYSVDHAVLVVGTSLASLTTPTQLVWFAFAFVTLSRYPLSVVRRNVQII